MWVCFSGEACVSVQVGVVGVCVCEPGYAEVLRCTESAPERCVFVCIHKLGSLVMFSENSCGVCVFLRTHVCMRTACLYVGDCVILYMCVNLAL